MRKIQPEKPKNIYVNNKTKIVYLSLRTIIIIILVLRAIDKDYESVAICALSLVLMLLPSIVERRFWVRLPQTLEIIILVFIFAAEILGEINSFFMKFPYWDTILHTTNGFLCAAVGFSLVDFINRSHKFTFSLSPLFLALVAFCFSMTVGVFWEFFEYSADTYFGQDMQKDTVINEIVSVNLNDVPSTKIKKMTDISEVIIVHSDGSEESLGVGGYLDIGIKDTMGDLFVNAIGAFVFSVIGYFYIKQRGEGEFATRFIPQVMVTDEEREKFEKEVIKKQ